MMSLCDTVRSTAGTAAFMLRVMPMLSSHWLDRFSPEPIAESVAIPGFDPRTPAELFRPGTPGPHAGVVVCLGVIPFEVTHPQVKRLGEALARRGFATLIVWSADMRSLRISQADTGLLVTAFDWMLTRPYVDPTRCGLLGTCVGGGFALMAAGQPEIRGRVAFVTCFAPFGSLRSLALDIGSDTAEIDGIRRVWNVDQLARHVYARTLTAGLEPAESALLEASWFERRPLPAAETLSSEARALLPLLATSSRAELERLLDRQSALRETIDAVSPIACAPDIRAPIIAIGHDRDDGVIPFGESQRLFAAFGGRPGVTLTEFHLFQHADPTRRQLSKGKLLIELVKFLRFSAPAMRQATIS